MTATATFDLLDLPTKILNDLAAGSAIEDLAAILCRLTEAHVPGHIASIMQMGEDGASAALSGLARGITLAKPSALQPPPSGGNAGAAIA
ncbi:hypothetical protein [Thiomonas sp. X19]|uniref:hypothetical protein n=1 Tax=Thiomonas sp. X19 TaxID=1050370 RepID=UPI0013142D2C|nr:hypothetical protein [Thiomonas sp. X19]